MPEPLALNAGRRLRAQPLHGWPAEQSSSNQPADPVKLLQSMGSIRVALFRRESNISRVEDRTSAANGVWTSGEAYIGWTIFSDGLDEATMLGRAVPPIATPGGRTRTRLSEGCYGRLTTGRGSNASSAEANFGSRIVCSRSGPVETMPMEAPVSDSMNRR